VLYEQRVVDCKQAERLLHRRLRQHRSASNKEFFHVPLRAAIKALEDVADEVGRIEKVVAGTPPALTTENDLPARRGEITVMPSRPQRGTTNPKKAKPVMVTFEDHAAYTDAIRRPILIDLRNRVFGLDDRLRQTERCTPAQRIAYNVPGEKVFLEVKGATSRNLSCN
jgi:T5orf172 domain